MNRSNCTIGCVAVKASALVALSGKSKHYRHPLQTADSVQSVGVILKFEGNAAAVQEMHLIHS